MRLNFEIPNQKNIQNAADQLYSEQVPLNKLALYSQWCRFDARLSEIWLEYIKNNFKNIDLIKFHIEIKKQVWPAATISLLEFLPLVVASSDKNLAISCVRLLGTDISPAPSEIFYFEIAKLGPVWQIKEVLNGQKAFSKWGFWSQDIPINKFTLKNQSHTLKNIESRMVILDQLIKDRKKSKIPITVDDYLLALKKSVSRRVAQLDLQNHPKLKKKGFTKNRVYWA